jgi:hypothetical protein
LVTPTLQVLLDRCRAEKAELRRCEKARVALGLEPESVGRNHALAEIDRRIAALSASRVTLLHDIAKQTPGYAVALHWAVEKYGSDVAVGTVRYNKRRDGCYTDGCVG